MVIEVVVITANRLPVRETRNASMGSFKGIPPDSVLSEICGGWLVGKSSCSTGRIPGVMGVGSGGESRASRGPRG